MAYEHWHRLLQDARYAPSAEMLRDYLVLCEGQESPTPYHVWSFLSMMAALVGSRIYLDRGPIGKLKLNLAVILIGSSAIRKSSAIHMMRNFSNGLPIQYGPDDTSGARQGIMSAMLPRWQYDYLEASEGIDVTPQTLKALSELDTSEIMASLPSPNIPPASELYFASDELGRLLGSSNSELINFFTDILDGKSIHYQLKSTSVRIPNPLANLLGATTPASLSTLLPRGIAEHGFLSRIIFVYADRLSSSTPIPVAWDSTQFDRRERMLVRIESAMAHVDGGIYLSESAQKTFQDVYHYGPEFRDTRLTAYAGRRGDHALRVASILAITRASQVVMASDVRLAHGILLLTESLMSRALHGLDTNRNVKINLAVHEVLEKKGEMKYDSLVNELSHAGNARDVALAIGDLEAAGKIKVHPGNIVKLVLERVELTQNRPFFQFKGAVDIDEYRSMVAG